MVHPVSPYSEDDGWMGAPLKEMDHFLRGESHKALVNEKAIQPFSILRALYESNETGKPVELDFS